MNAAHRPVAGRKRCGTVLLLAALPCACGGAPAAGGAAGPDPAPVATAGTGAPRPPYVPVQLGSRTLLTQPPEESRDDRGAPPAVEAEDRVVGEDAVPEPRATRPRPSGDAAGLEPERVRAVIHDQMSRFRHCFERLRQGNPDATEARVTVRFTIERSGGVASAALAGAVPNAQARAPRLGPGPRPGAPLHAPPRLHPAGERARLRPPQQLVVQLDGRPHAAKHKCGCALLSTSPTRPARHQRKRKPRFLLIEVCLPVR